MKIRLCFVCNSSSSDFICEDGNGCNSYADGKDAGREELIEEIKENIFNYFPKEKKFNSTSETEEQSKRETKIYNRVVEDCKEAILKVLKEL